MNGLTSRAYALVLAIALAASASSLRNGFVYDDVPIVVEDRRIRDLAQWPDIVRQRYWPTNFGDDQLYRPLTSLSFAVDWKVGGGRPFVFHAVNLALHLLVVALVLALAGRFLPPGAAVVAGLWFAVHPVHAEAVANVVGRSELLAAAGYLVAALAYVAGGEPDASPRRRGALAAGVFVAGALAAGAKEHALTLPVALLLLDAWRAWMTGERFSARLRRTWGLWFAAVAAGVLFLLVRDLVIGVGFGHGQVAAGLEGKGALQRFVAMLPGYFTWARLLTVPLRLSADYSPDAIRPVLAVTPAHVGGMIVVGAAVVLAWWSLRRAPAVAFGLLWFVATASVAANLVVPTGLLLAERTLYLPSAGVAIALGALWDRLPARGWVWPATAAVLALLAARGIERNTLWRDNTKFFERLAGDAAASYRSHWMRGTWEFRRGRFAAGERLYLEALRVYPYDANLVAELGMWYLDAKAYDPADRFLSMALRMDSTLSDAAVKGIFARTMAGRHDSAAALARVAARRWPDDPGLLLISIHALQQAGLESEAARLSPALLTIAPARWEYLQIAAEAAARAGRCNAARALVGRALARAAAAEPAPGRLRERIGRGTDCAARLR